MFFKLRTADDSFVFVCDRLSARLPQRESSIFSSALDVCSTGRYINFEVSLLFKLPHLCTQKLPFTDFDFKLFFVFLGTLKLFTPVKQNTAMNSVFHRGRCSQMVRLNPLREHWLCLLIV